jgi:hypothetical protein
MGGDYSRPQSPPLVTSSNSPAASPSMMTSMISVEILSERPSSVTHRIDRAARPAPLPAARAFLLRRTHRLCHLTRVTTVLFGKQRPVRPHNICRTLVVPRWCQSLAAEMQETTAALREFIETACSDCPLAGQQIRRVARRVLAHRLLQRVQSMKTAVLRIAKASARATTPQTGVPRIWA